MINPQIKTSSLTFSVGIPAPLMSLLNGQLLRRLLTIEPFVEFHQMEVINKIKVIAKVFFVGLLALGIAASVAYMSHITVAAIPLCLVCTMGLSFNFLTEDIALQAKAATSAAQKGAVAKIDGQ